MKSEYTKNEYTKNTHLAAEFGAAYEYCEEMIK